MDNQNTQVNGMLSVCVYLLYQVLSGGGLYSPPPTHMGPGEGVCLGVYSPSPRTRDLGYNGIRSASGRYASYSNAFLCCHKNTLLMLNSKNDSKRDSLEFNYNVFLRLGTMHIWPLFLLLNLFLLLFSHLW